VGYVARIHNADHTLDERCVILDVSDFGAQLRVADSSKLPDEFILALSDCGAPARACTVAWRSAQKLGVSFADRPLPPR
jgi:hypothetical protein